jgi:prolyl-tRNA editing enzyme YbaK/EbsC (Cys-tRNA(Pro) deacylase)
LRIADRQDVIVMACGDARVDNTKAKVVFGAKARFVAAEDAPFLRVTCPVACAPSG